MLNTADKQIISATVGGVAAQLAEAQRITDAKRDENRANKAAADAIEADRLAFFDKVLDQVYKGFWNVAVLTTQDDMIPLYQSLKEVDKTFTLWQEDDEHMSVGVLLRQERIGLFIEEPDGHEHIGHMGHRYDIERTKRWYRPDRKNQPPCFAKWFGDSFQWPDWHDDGPEMDIEEASWARRKISKAYLEQMLSLDFGSLAKQTQETLAWFKEEKRLGSSTCRSAWIENNISPAQVLGKFFYDCADPAVLQQHLSTALKQLRV